MVWARLDDAILDNEKIQSAGVYGFSLHVAAISWCCRNLTDGIVPRGTVRRLIDMSRVCTHESNPLGLPGGISEGPISVGLDASTVADHLVSIGLWHRVDDGGYQIHDFLEYNPSRAEVLGKRRKNAQKVAAKRGRRVSLRSDVPQGTDGGTGQGTTLDSRDPVHTRVPHAVPTHVPPLPGPDPDPGLNPPSPPGGGSAREQARPLSPSEPKRKASRARPRVGCPNATAPEAAAFCLEHKLPPPTDPNVARMLNVYSSKGLTYSNWLGAFHAFVEREAQWAAERAAKFGTQAAAGGRQYEPEVTGYIHDLFEQKCREGDNGF